MVISAINSGLKKSDMESIVSHRSKPTTYVVSNLLPQSRIEWLRQQSVHVAEVFRRSADKREPS
jgi:hypothetical protein